MPITLYAHQIKALKKMKNGCILNGGTGSGKSLTSISYYYIQNGGYKYSLTGQDYRRMKDPPLDLYIITTARKRDTHDWEGELTPFLLSPDADANSYSNKVVIDSWNNIKKYKSIEHSFFIFDEQRVVGSGAWVRSFIQISKKNRWILLSATPGDTWSDYAPVFIANGFYKNITEFRLEHIVYSTHVQYPKIDRYLNTKKLNRLRSLIVVPMEFKRSTVQHHIDVFCEYRREDLKIAMKDRWNPYTDKPFKNASELCSTLRKMVNADPSRQVKLLEIMEEHPKLIIFYNFDYELEILRSCLSECTSVAEWNGHKHEPVPVGNKWAYLVQYSSGSEAWNCIETDTIIFFSQNYSYRIVTQSSGRIDRLNTPYKDLYYYHFKSRSRIDLAISRALKNKEDFNEMKWVCNKVSFEKPIKIDAKVK